LDKLDVVLGNAWLKGIGKIILDYDGRSLEFTRGDRVVTWSMGGLPNEEMDWEGNDGMTSRISKVTLGVKGTLYGRGNERIPSGDMGGDSHALEDRCRDEAPMTHMGNPDKPTARATTTLQPCHGISSRARKLGAPAPLTRHGALSTPMPGMPASPPQPCHDSPWPCPDTTTQQALGHQPSHAAEGKPTIEWHDKGWPPPAATTSGGAPPPIPVLGGEWKRTGQRSGGTSPPMVVPAEAAPPWTAADGGKI
jgi:hypothetical protein